jgi:hypothetical protein
MAFRSLLLLASALSLATAAVAAPEVSIRRVWLEPRDDASFKRISEFFTGREDTAGRVIVRSQPEVREGLYWMVRATSDQAIPAGEILLEVIAPDRNEPTTYRLPFAAPGRRSVAFLAGLTGNDWPNPRARPTAWRLTITGPDGSPLAASASFLWEMPAN